MLGWDEERPRVRLDCGWYFMFHFHFQSPIPTFWPSPLSIAKGETNKPWTTTHYRETSAMAQQDTGACAHC